MTTISPTQSFQTGATSFSPEPSSVSEDFNTFIELLVAQVRNQDPLEPTDSTQFVEQLATFSALEQQVETNNNLEAIGFLINDLHAIIANEWLGETVAVETSHVPFEGDEVTFQVPENAKDLEADLVVRNMTGEVLWSQAANTKAGNLVWDGKTARGEKLPEGTLVAVSLEATGSGTAPIRVNPEVVTKVTGVATEYGKMRLATDLNMSVGMEQARKID